MYDENIGEMIFWAIVFVFVVGPSLAFVVSLTISLIVGATYKRVDLGAKCGIPMAVLSSPTGLFLFFFFLEPHKNSLTEVFMVFVGTGLFFSALSWVLIRFIDSRAEASYDAQRKPRQPLQ